MTRSSKVKDCSNYNIGRKRILAPAPPVPDARSEHSPWFGRSAGSLISSYPQRNYGYNKRAAVCRSQLAKLPYPVAIPPTAH